ncbi:hypothetical protein SDC9_204126 [bioreactor metagenome]|uniref:CDP-diacylglycerol--glycerol-3-phosphate 3-phosphatidyltransferase n=2 Tax=root TaxID=1 RepID=A0A645IZ40_9ZZZZ
MGAALWLSMGPAESWLHMNLGARVLYLAVLVVVGATTYFATLWTLGFRLGDFKRRAAE